MAAGAFTSFNKAKPKHTDGTCPISHTFKVALISGSTALSAGFTGASGNARFSDVSANQVSGSGYTAGGQAVTLTVSESSGTVTIACTTASWSNVTLSGAVYAVLYDDTNANKDMLGYVALDSGLAPQSGTFSSFQVQFPTGIVTY